MGMLNHHIHSIIKRRLITNAGRVSTFYAAITFTVYQRCPDYTSTYLKYGK